MICVFLDLHAQALVYLFQFRDLIFGKMYLKLSSKGFLLLRHCVHRCGADAEIFGER
jgi:hypothetical protein